MVTSINTLKNWFKTGLKPTQAQFWDWLDSFRHKNDPVPASDVSGLQDLLNGKLNKPVNAVAGNMPMFDGNGQLIDSGVSPGSGSSVLPSTWEYGIAAIRSITAHESGMDVGNYQTGSVYEYDELDNTPDDGDNILKPIDVIGDGRWMKIRTFSIEGHTHNWAYIISLLPIYDTQEAASSLANYAPFKTSTGYLCYKLPAVAPSGIFDQTFDNTFN